MLVYLGDANMCVTMVYLMYLWNATCYVSVMLMYQCGASVGVWRECDVRKYKLSDAVILHKLGMAVTAQQYCQLELIFIDLKVVHLQEQKWAFNCAQCLAFADKSIQQSGNQKNWR